MKQTIAFKKEVLFKTQVHEITSISLEHHVNLVETNTISGNFLITGDYKMTEASVNKETFNFTIPFDIAVNDEYIIDEAKTEITDFFYEITNNEILKVNIELTLNNLSIKEENIRNNDYLIMEDMTVSELVETIDDKKNKKEITSIENKKDMNNNYKIADLFKELNEEDVFSTYKVYILREDDTIEKVLELYGISRDILEKYNDIDNIEVGDKLIIPTN